MKIKFVAFTFLISLFLLSACSAFEGETGTLQGKVTIGPLTPVVKAGETPAAPSGEMFTSLGIEILKGGKDEVYKTVHFNADGTYSVKLPEGNYIVRSISTDPYRATGLPTSVKITKGNIMVLDITIDTGIR